MPSWARNWLTPAGWVAAVAALLLLVFPTGFPNYDTIYALLWGREMSEGLSPDTGAALPPTPHPLAELFGLVASPARRRRDRPDDGDRLRQPRPRRLPRLPPRLALVRPRDRRRRGGDHPHPRALPLERAPRLRRHPVHRPRARRPGDRDPPPAGRVAGPRPPRPRRPPPPRGLALLIRISRISRHRLRGALSRASAGWRRRSGSAEAARVPLESGGYSKRRPD